MLAGAEIILITNSQQIKLLSIKSNNCLVHTCCTVYYRFRPTLATLWWSCLAPATLQHPLIAWARAHCPLQSLCALLPLLLLQLPPRLTPSWSCLFLPPRLLMMEDLLQNASRLIELMEDYSPPLLSTQISDS